MTTVALVDVRLTARDLISVSVVSVLRSRITPTLLAAGPVLWGVGALSGSQAVMRFGGTVSWLLVLVPAFALLVGMNSAYRPGSGDLYERASWTFADEGVVIGRDGVPSRAAEWSEFASWRMVAGCYVLYTAPRRYVVVPARGLADADRVALEALLSERLGTPRR